jgi:hypothetical protein
MDIIGSETVQAVAPILSATYPLEISTQVGSQNRREQLRQFRRDTSVASKEADCAPRLPMFGRSAPDHA